MTLPETAAPDTKAFLFLAGTLTVTVEREAAPQGLVRLTATLKNHSKQWARIHWASSQLAESYFAAMGIPEAVAWWRNFHPEPPRPVVG